MPPAVADAVHVGDAVPHAVSARLACHCHSDLRGDVHFDGSGHSHDFSLPFMELAAFLVTELAETRPIRLARGPEI